MPTQTDTTLLQMALIGYEAERQKIQEKIAEIQARLNGRSRGAVSASADTPAPRTRRRMSAAARRRIAAAQRKRWAAFQGSGARAVSKKTVRGQKSAARPKRRMSAAARKRISEATKKRWAAYRRQKAA